MKHLFFFFAIVFVSCTATKWKKKYVEEYTSRLISQYSKDGNISFVFGESKVMHNSLPQRDSNGFISAKYYKPITSYRKKQIKILMSEWEQAAAIIPDSLKKIDGNIDSIYLNPYKIKFLQQHGLKSDHMVFINSSQRKQL